MSVIIGLFFVAIAIGISILIEKKRAPVREPQRAAAKIPSSWQGIFVHPGHTWVKVLQPSLVSVGADQFTNAVFGSVRELKLPEEGAMIQQGGKVWGLKRGKRELVQTAPISGRVAEVNKDLLHNPKLLVQKDTQKNWILKVQPLRLKRELQNLLRGNMLRRWNQTVKEQLVATLSMTEFPVLQEGGEIKPDLGDELTSQQWEKVAQEFF